MQIKNNDNSKFCKSCGKILISKNNHIKIFDESDSLFNIVNFTNKNGRSVNIVHGTEICKNQYETQ